MAKIQPSVLNIQFSIAEGADPKYLDISQAASIVNRRFYRQGIQWVVAGFTIHNTAPQVGNVTIAKLPSTWVCSNSWHKAYAHWKAQQDDAVDEAGAQSAVAKYRDFKIHMGIPHVLAGFTANLIPVDMSNTQFLQGEWQRSQIVLPNVAADASGSVVDPQEYYLHMVGVNNASGSRGMIDGYANSRSYPQSPDPVSPAIGGASNWYMQMENVGNESPEVVQNATERNDQLPYDQNDYPGADINAPTLELVHKISFSAAAPVSTGLTTTRQLSGTTVPCGLLEIDNDVNGPINFTIHLVPGPSRGYLTQPMQDM